MSLSLARVLRRAWDVDFAQNRVSHQFRLGLIKVQQFSVWLKNQRGDAAARLRGTVVALRCVLRDADRATGKFNAAIFRNFLWLSFVSPPSLLRLCME